MTAEHDHESLEIHFVDECTKKKESDENIYIREICGPRSV